MPALVRVSYCHPPLRRAARSRPMLEFRSQLPQAPCFELLRTDSSTKSYGLQGLLQDLGVARDASQDEIKRVYRRLARKYHPDVSKEANAEEKFKEVQEAYEVLKDPEKRAAYDQLGIELASRPGIHAAAGLGQRLRVLFDGVVRRSPRTAGFSDFFSSLFGARSPFGQQRGGGTARRLRVGRRGSRREDPDRSRRCFSRRHADHRAQVAATRRRRPRRGAASHAEGHDSQQASSKASRFDWRDKAAPASAADRRAICISRSGSARIGCFRSKAAT